MMKQLRTKFIAATMVSLLLVLVVILSGINLLNYRNAVSDANDILSVLLQNKGNFPLHDLPDEMTPPDTMPQANAVQSDKKAQQGQPWGTAPNEHKLSPEAPYESRYFSVLLSAEGDVLQSNVNQIAAVDAETAAEYAQSVAQGTKTTGFRGYYRYAMTTEGANTRIIFLDCTRSLSNVRNTLLASIGVTLLGLLAVFWLLVLLSGRIIKPVAESYEKQKRFITDAGHEIKTPLTIISADADLAELENGESEWLTDIKRQTSHLTALTNNLIYLSRMDEEQPPLQPIEFPISDLVCELAQSFLAPSKTQGKTLSIEVQPMLSYTGDETALRQLCSVLLDNALKYSPDGGNICIRLEKQSRSLRLTVANTVASPIPPEKLNLMFDRFYRTDQSRNSQTGGYGLGLSIAKSIVIAHKGKISASQTDSATLCIVVSLPL